MNNLYILYWNSNGIKNKIYELQVLGIKLKIDIILLYETRISPKTNIKISNYHNYQNEPLSIHGSLSHGCI